uniref:Uncharacterized protein n=1 Tax=Sphaerodactylus townsendi TaxID=933632 RepID=A0ACB8FJC7_9SAUR
MAAAAARAEADCSQLGLGHVGARRRTAEATGRPREASLEGGRGLPCGQKAPRGRHGCLRGAKELASSLLYKASADLPSLPQRPLLPMPDPAAFPGAARAACEEPRAPARGRHCLLHLLPATPTRALAGDPEFPGSCEAVKFARTQHNRTVKLGGLILPKNEVPCCVTGEKAAYFEATERLVMSE